MFAAQSAMSIRRRRKSQKREKIIKSKGMYYVIYVFIFIYSYMYVKCSNEMKKKDFSKNIEILKQFSSLSKVQHISL